MKLHNPRALVADDDDFFRMALQAVLTRKLGFSHVIEAGSLDEALEHLTKHTNISLALFDLAMPGMKTAASLAAVREGFPDLRTAVVSGSKRRQDILLALEAGVHGYVPKDITPVELTDALRLIVDGVIYVPAAVAALPSSPDKRDVVLAQPTQVATIGDLTPRQRDVLELLVQGQSNKQIARSLHLGEGTVKVHMAALFRAFNLNSRAAVAVAGLQILHSP